MQQLKKHYKMFISACLILFYINPLQADDVDLMSSSLDVLRNQEQQIYYPGNGIVLNYMFPGMLQDILDKTTPYAVIHSPLGAEPLVLPLNAETQRSHALFVADDVSSLPAGDYYFSVILTVPGGDPLDLSDWYLGPYGRISYERLRISATTSDADDLNHDGQFDSDRVDMNGFTDPSVSAQVTENPIQLNQQIFYSGSQLKLSYTLPSRISDVFAGRANAYLAVKMPAQSNLLYLPLAALEADGNLELVTLPDLSSMPEGDYLLGVVFTQPGGNPADVRDWYPNISSWNDRKRVAISHQSSDERDFDANGFFDTDNNGDGTDDMLQLEAHIAALCPNENETCRYNKLPAFIARSAEIGDLMDELCKDSKSCAESLQEKILQDAFSADDSATSVLCAADDSSCLQSVAFPVYQAKYNVKKRNQVFQELCTGIANTEVCQNSGLKDSWAVLYEHIRNINNILREPLFKQICPDGSQCGANGGFGGLVENEMEFWKLIDALCKNDTEGNCIDTLFDAMSKASEAALAGNFSETNYQEEYNAAYEQGLNTFFCASSTLSTCASLVGKLAKNEGKYSQLLTGICGQNTTCMELVANTASNMSTFVSVRQAAVALCQTDTNCLTKTVPEILALGALTLNDPAIDEMYTKVCGEDLDFSCGEHFYTLAFAEYEITDADLASTPDATGTDGTVVDETDSTVVDETDSTVADESTLT